MQYVNNYRLKHKGAPGGGSVRLGEQGGDGGGASLVFCTATYVSIDYFEIRALTSGAGISFLSLFLSLAIIVKRAAAQAAYQRSVWWWYRSRVQLLQQQDTYSFMSLVCPTTQSPCARALCEAEGANLSSYSLCG